MSSAVYQINGYSSNSITLSYNPNFEDRGPATRLTMQNVPMNRFMLGKIMAAQEVFRERGAAIAYPFLASGDWVHQSRSETNPNGPAQFTVGDRFLVSAFGYPFASILGFSFYNTMVAVNKMYLQHRSQNSNAIAMNSVGLGDYLLNKIRELPNGSERQELVGVMVYLVTNGFFTAERIHALYRDVEADISHAQANGIEHRSILPYPLRNVAPFNRNQGPTGPIPSEYPPMTDRAPSGYETSIVRRLSLGNCLYKPEFFRANKMDIMTGDVTDRVTDEEIQINRNVTRMIISSMNSNE